MAGKPPADGARLVKRNLVVERHVQRAREILREQAEPLQEFVKRRQIRSSWNVTPCCS